MSTGSIAPDWETPEGLDQHFSGFGVLVKEESTFQRCEHHFLHA
jgi:hypothetical protein